MQLPAFFHVMRYINSQNLALVLCNYNVCLAWVVIKLLGIFFISCIGIIWARKTFSKMYWRRWDKYYRRWRKYT